MLLVSYALVLASGFLAAFGLLVGAAALLVAVCIAVGDKMEGQLISRVTWWSFGLVLLLPVWALMVRAIWFGG
ncbi:MAG: uncharacterized membrane protein YhaH (DUF805 family) [Planctomycetota bacterium]|jgi:uncharacterized membrane protein YhaH (DUF805 family)